MKSIIAVFLLIFAVTDINAQSKFVTGSVKDANGNPLHFVFVGNNNEDKVATFTDSLGNFSLAVTAAKGLYFSLKGYKDTSVNLDNSTNLRVVLHAGGITGSQPALTAAPIQQSTGNDAIPTFGSGGSIVPAHQQGALHGNRYLFDTFVHGFVLSSTGELVHNTNYLFDYDKIGGALLLTTDNSNITLVSWDLTKSFTLFTNHDQVLVFTKVPAIDQQHYVQVLASGTKYSIYKFIKTTFVRADYVNTGVSSHGNDYDSYDDDNNYYIINQAGGAPIKFALKKSALKKVFAADSDKLNQFISAHASEDVDDIYLEKLGSFMNN